MILANCPATITLTGSSTWKSGRYITSHIPCLIIRSWTGTKFQCARRVTASLKVTYASELRICVEMRRHVGMSAAGVRSRIRVKLFFLFLLSFSSRTAASKVFHGSMGLDWPILGWPVRTQAQCKVARNRGLVGRRRGGGDQGGRKKGRDWETTVLLSGNDPFKLDEKF